MILILILILIYYLRCNCSQIQVRKSQCGGEARADISGITDILPYWYPDNQLSSYHIIGYFGIVA